jgi:hypothetical protein
MLPFILEYTVQVWTIRPYICNSDPIYSMLDLPSMPKVWKHWYNFKKSALPDTIWNQESVPFYFLHAITIYSYPLPTLKCRCTSLHTPHPYMDHILKGIVCRVWEQLQWHPSDRSEEFRIAGAYFYALFIPFSCFNSKKACCSGFSFDSYSANDE